MRHRNHTGRLAAGSTMAGLGLLLVLLATSAFAVWATQATSTAATHAAATSQLSDAYADAAVALAAEESWERRYRLGPSPAIMADYDQSTVAFTAAMRRVQLAGKASDRALVERASLNHRDLLAANDNLFRAVDSGNELRTRRIDRIETDPPRAALEGAVSGAAESAHASSLADLVHLQSLERRTRLLTPMIFFLGLFIATLLSTVTRRYRRQLLTERAQALHDSLHDPLSGLPNRRLLSERLEQTLGAGGLGPAGATALLLIDLDRFKEINDTFGHRYGDELLTRIGPRLTGVLRGVDTVARLGGDEFAVLVPGVESVAEAMALAARLAAVLEPSFHVFGVDLDIEASIGVVVAGEHGDDPVTLMQRADIAMYVAKTDGLGVCSYRRDIDQHSPARLAMFGELREGLERGELLLYFQPQVAIDTGELVGVEALVRWQHPTRGLTLPDDFIPLAERTGLIAPLTRTVLDAALSQARIWSDAGLPLKVSVNLSARNLIDEDLPEMVADLLAQHGVPVRLLELEVTESAVVIDALRATRTLERLATLRVRLSMDDFGAGYTSLGQLKTLPISELKIDKSFVLTVTEDPGNARIVEGIITIGHNLGHTVVAEGVETEAALDFLRLAGCDIAQGFHFSEPLPVEAFNTWRAAHHASLGSIAPTVEVGA